MKQTFLKKPYGTVDYITPPSGDRLQSAGGDSFGYDDEGQMTSAYGQIYTFDYEHRLTAISGQQSAFSYDGAGNL